MVAIAHECAACGATNSSFQLDFSEPCLKDARVFAAIGLCGGCEAPALMVFRSSYRSEIPPTKLSGADFSSYMELIGFQPRPAAPRLPQHTPEQILNVLREAEANRSRRAAGVHSAAMTYGKVLDLATKAAGGTEHKLSARITELADSGKITKELGEWMKTLNVVRNEATHDDEPYTLQEVDDLGEATQLLLQYLFTMPGMLKTIKDAHAAKLAAGVVAA